MTMVRARTLAGAVMLVVAALAGCAAEPRATTKPDRPQAAAPSSGSPRLNSNTDPCAMRLHDVCAPLLLFYGRYQMLPQRIEELAQVPGVDVPELACPVSNRKYVYNPHGPSGPDAGTRIILYDAAPTHAGRRWGIAVREPTRGQALVAKVVVVPDAKFNGP